jgi:hypothetical protein
MERKAGEGEQNSPCHPKIPLGRGCGHHVRVHPSRYRLLAAAEMAALSSTETGPYGTQQNIAPRAPQPQGAGAIPVPPAPRRFAGFHHLVGSTLPAMTSALPTSAFGCSTPGTAAIVAGAPRAYDTGAANRTPCRALSVSRLSAHSGRPEYHAVADGVVQRRPTRLSQVEWPHGHRLVARRPRVRPAHRVLHPQHGAYALHTRTQDQCAYAACYHGAQRAHRVLDPLAAGGCAGTV